MHSPFGHYAPHFSPGSVESADGMNLASLNNPYAAAITQALGKRVPPSPTSAPEMYSHTMQRIIAEHEEVHPENVFVGNGRNVLLHQLFTSLAPQQVILVGPVPQDYHDVLEQRQIPCLQIPLTPGDELTLSPQDLQKLRETRADLAILSSPNWYTGTVISGIQAIFSIIRAPQVLVDTSLQDFLYSSPSYYAQRYLACVQSLRPGISLFMLNDITPFFSCPGICLAYLLGDKHPLAAIQRQSPPYATPSYSQALGELLFQHMDDYRATLSSLTADVTATAISLRRSPLFVPDLVFEGPSCVCAGLSLPKVQNAITSILHKHRIHIASIPGTCGLPPGFVRISAINGDSLSYLEQILALAADTLLP